MHLKGSVVPSPAKGTDGEKHPLRQLVKQTVQLLSMDLYTPGMAVVLWAAIQDVTLP